MLLFKCMINNVSTVLNDVFCILTVMLLCLLLLLYVISYHLTALLLNVICSVLVISVIFRLVEGVEWAEIAVAVLSSADTARVVLRMCSTAVASLTLSEHAFCDSCQVNSAWRIETINSQSSTSQHSHSQWLFRLISRQRMTCQQSLDINCHDDTMAERDLCYNEQNPVYYKI